MMSAIAQKLAQGWELDELAGKSNFGGYQVKVAVEVNADGFIVSKVRPLTPKVPKGNYLLAFESAEKAILRANPLPIVPKKYPQGIIFEITFDPETGFSF